MPCSGPLDRIVYPTLKVMIDSYNDVQPSFLSHQISAVFGDNKVDGITRKPAFGVSDKILHKPACTATEDALSLKFQIQKVEEL